MQIKMKAAWYLLHSFVEICLTGKRKGSLLRKAMIDTLSHSFHSVLNLTVQSSPVDSVLNIFQEFITITLLVIAPFPNVHYTSHFFLETRCEVLQQYQAYGLVGCNNISLIESSKV